MLCVLGRGKNSITIDSLIQIYSALHASYIRIYDSIDLRSFSLTYSQSYPGL